MSQQLINRSNDLKKLRDEGYCIKIKSAFLLVNDVPYVNFQREVKLGIIVSKLILAGDRTTKPEDHVAYFIGECPCHPDGSPLREILNNSNRQQLADGIIIDHMFSAKPVLPQNSYADYYHKMTTYVSHISRHAQAISPGITAQNFNPVTDVEEVSVFNYYDTATSRAEIDLISKKLALGNVAIIGLGGSGSYVLDLIAKTSIKTIHLFDGDTFFQHNAFRAPGAPSLAELETRPTKASYFKGIYSKMHRNIIEHEFFIDSNNVEKLREMNFVFLCLDRGSIKKMIISKLAEFGVPFVDVGLGVHIVDNALTGILRVTIGTQQKNDHIETRIPFSDDEIENEYSNNIQIADLNALNAVLAVIKWKKLYGFYHDLEHEHHSTYTIDGNNISNQEQYEAQ